MFLVIRKKLDSILEDYNKQVKQNIVDKKEIEEKKII